MKDNALIRRIKKIRWINRWAGSYTFISCSYWGSQYYHSLKKHLGVYFEHTLFFHRRGTVSFYIPEKEFIHLGKTLAKRSEKNHACARKYCQKLKSNTDVLLPLMKKLQHKISTRKEYSEFLKAFDRHLAFHVFVKKTIDFLSVKQLEKLLPVFKDARLYSEKIYSESEKFFRNIGKIIAKKEKINPDYLTCLTQVEFEGYLKSGLLPNKKVLKERFSSSVLYFEKDKATIITGKVVNKLENQVAKQKLKNKKEIRGIIAYPGRVKGKARIVLDPFSVKLFNDGDVLITGMTRPEFMPLVRKAAAIVTDVGGVLCHAAITARELKIPCIVGTGIATKVLRNGNFLEIDATKGVAKILNH